jgi:hypothetical protein
MRRAERLCVGPRMLFAVPMFGEGLVMLPLSPGRDLTWRWGCLHLRGCRCTASHLLTAGEAGATGASPSATGIHYLNERVHP